MIWAIYSVSPGPDDDNSTPCDSEEYAFAGLIGFDKASTENMSVEINAVVILPTFQVRLSLSYL